MSPSRASSGEPEARRVELIYFEGCPHVADARANLDVALEGQSAAVDVYEWSQDDPAAPSYVRRLASPTVLVDGRDVAGETAGTGPSCRAEGAPSVGAIRRALAER